MTETRDNRTAVDEPVRIVTDSPKFAMLSWGLTVLLLAVIGFLFYSASREQDSGTRIRDLTQTGVLAACAFYFAYAIHKQRGEIILDSEGIRMIPVYGGAVCLSWEGMNRILWDRTWIHLKGAEGGICFSCLLFPGEVRSIIMKQIRYHVGDAFGLEDLTLEAPAGTNAPSRIVARYVKELLVALGAIVFFFGFLFLILYLGSTYGKGILIAGLIVWGCVIVAVCVGSTVFYILDYGKKWHRRLGPGE